jgi:oligopeptidase A
MIDNLIKSKNFLSAMGMLRQLEFSLFDILLHKKPHSKEQTQELLDSIREKTSLIKPPAYNKFQNGFSHIFSGGYAAGYYSYKWAEVLSADLFFRVVDEGIFGSPMAQKYLKIVLQGGGSQSMQKLFYEMTNEAPNPKSLLRLSGISA